MANKWFFPPMHKGQKGGFRPAAAGAIGAVFGLRLRKGGGGRKFTAGKGLLGGGRGAFPRGKGGKGGGGGDHGARGDRGEGVAEGGLGRELRNPRHAAAEKDSSAKVGRELK